MQEENSHNVNLILTRLKSALKINSDAELADGIGVARNVLSNWKKRGTLDYRLLFTYCESKGISIDWLFNHKYEIVDRAQVVKEPATSYNTRPNRGSLPLIPTDAKAGFSSGNDLSVTYIDCEKYDIPEFYGLAEFLIKVSGDSMQPRYLNGDTLACRRITADWIQWNRAYVLDTDQGPLVKRVRKGSSDDTLTLESDNKAYEAFEIPRSSVRSMALIIGFIRLQ